jgi:hypothetical protein
VKPAVSPVVVLHVTDVGPSGNTDPETGEQLTVPHAPFAVASGYVTTALHALGSVD